MNRKDNNFILFSNLSVVIFFHHQFPTQNGLEIAVMKWHCFGIVVFYAVF